MPRTNLVKVDLADNLQRYERGVLLASADKAANKLGAEVYQDGKAATLTGYTVVGYFIRTGVDTITINGTIDGNTAYVVLPSDCYKYDGGFTLAVKLRKTGYEQTLAIFDGFIAQTMTNNIIDSAKVVPFMETILKRNCYNWLDNSFFVQPVNQRGETSYSNAGYGIDRWRHGNSALTVAVASNGVRLTNSSTDTSLAWQQLISHDLAGKAVTIAICQSNGTITIASGTVATGSVTSDTAQFSAGLADGSGSIALYKNAIGLYSMRVFVGASKVATLRWAALYEGAFNAETLPPYQPKGYAAEFAECRRYYIRHNIGEITPWLVTAASNARRYYIAYPQRMRSGAPTLVLSELRERCIWTDTGATIEASTSTADGISLIVTGDASDNASCHLGGTIASSADL